MNKIEKLLRRDDIGFVVSCGKVRLYYDDVNGEWVVKNFRRTVYRGVVLDHAVEWFEFQFDKAER